MFKRLFNITICLVMVLGSLSIVGGEQTVMAEVANLDDIAGISAYTQVTVDPEIDFITSAKSACSTIPELEVVEIINELPVVQYFICSVNIEGYADVYAPHVFVHKDGWIMAYYLKEDPAAKMIDVIAQPLPPIDPEAALPHYPTLLENAIKTIAGDEVDFSYYDFSNPNATDMLFVAEDKAEDLGEFGDDDHWFTIALPEGTYGEISYAFYQNYSPLFAKDGVNFVTTNADYIGPVPYGSIYGMLVPNDLLIGESHLFEVDTFSYANAGYGALVITHSGVVDEFAIDSADWVEEFILETPPTDLTALFTFDFAPGSFAKSSEGVYVIENPTEANISWGISGGATGYEYCIDKSEGLICDTGWVSTGTATSVTLTGLPFNTTFYWQVRAVNSYETTEADEGVWASFVTKTGPPNAFSKLSPTNLLEGVATSPLLDWSEAVGAEYYEYCITTETTCTDWVNTGLVTQVIVNLQVNGEYNWQVRAGNSVGQTYADEVYWSFKTVMTTFEKTSPAIGTTGVDPKATLLWEGMDGATSYQYCVDTTDNNSCTRWLSVGDVNEVTIKGLKYNTTYYWQVRAVTSTGTIEADDGKWWSFTTRDRKAPIKQTPVFNKESPTNGATDQVYSNLLLDWEDVSKVTSYDYCIDMSDDDACSNWIKVYESQVIIPELTPLQTYYWQVRATVAGIVGYADGGYWSFTTMDEPIIEPEPIP